MANIFSLREQLNNSNLSETLERIEQKLDHLIEQTSSQQQSIQPKEILDVIDVANICKVAQGSVYNWVYKGKIPYCKANGRLLFKRSDVEDFISMKENNKWQKKRLSHTR